MTADDKQKPPTDKPKRKHVKTGRPRGFDKKFKHINKDIVRKAYMTWDWETQEELTQMIAKEYGETISTQYISRHALREGWEDTRTMALTGTGPKFLASIQALKRDASHFDALEHLKGLQSRLVKRMAAEIVANPNPEFFIGMMDVYHSIQKAITETWEYKLRQQNDNSPTPPGGPGKKPEIKENVPAQISAHIAPFKKRSP